MPRMRIALVSPYSWTYPGGVTRHIEALAAQHHAAGHHVRVFAPYDPPDSLSTRLHRGHAPEDRPLPEWVVPLGRTVGIPANGAVSNVALSVPGVQTMRRELTAGRFDVVHVHEPIAPLIGWDVLRSCDVPMVGTFHCFSENVVTNNIGNIAGARWRLNQLKVRIAVSEAAAWTGRRFYGGDYRIIPNGGDVPEVPPVHSPPSPAGHLAIASVRPSAGRNVPPPPPPAFEALREQVPATLTIVGATPEQVEALVLDRRGIEILGRVDDATKFRVLTQADVLAAPSLGGESFGMVLTEAFAAGTPVVASDIAGYRDVVRDGVDGMLVPRGDATALAQALHDLAFDPARRTAMAREALAHAPTYAWPKIGAQVAEAYGDAIAVPEPVGLRQRTAVRVGVTPRDLRPKVAAERLPSLEPDTHNAPRTWKTTARKAALVLVSLLAIALAGLALEHIGVDKVVASLLHSSPPWVLGALGLMCTSMVMRGVAWTAILRAALPGVKVRYADALQGTFIGVLMSATLPARLGEPARAMIVSRRLGNVRERLPVVLGTLVSQTMLNILALVILGVVMFSTVGYFSGHQGALVLFTLAPIAIMIAVLLLPMVLRPGAVSRSSRMHTILRQARGALVQVRAGLMVFRSPRYGSISTAAQLTAWALQWASCYVLLVAFGLESQAGIGAAAAVLFAVNVTAVLPATPSNLGVFQAACVAVLTGAYGVSSADALGYGIVLQAVEIATAVVMGMPALLKEGLSWKDVRLRAIQTSPVQLQTARSSRDEQFEIER